MSVIEMFHQLRTDFVGFDQLVDTRSEGSYSVVA
jgi:hypothetical protein